MIHRPSGVTDLIANMVILAVRDCRAGNGHSQSARLFLEDDGWTTLLSVTPESVQRIRDFALGSQKQATDKR